MDIKVLHEDVTQVKVPALVVNLFQNVSKPAGATGAIDKALDGAISQLIDDGEIRGKKGEITLVHTRDRIGPSRVLVAGLGKAEEFDLQAIREVSAESCRYLRKVGIERIATIAHGAGIGGLTAEESAQALAEGCILGLYQFRNYLKQDEDGRDVREFIIVEGDASKVADLESGVARGQIMAVATNLARDMINEPANVLTPTLMAEIAQQVAEEGDLDVQVLDRHHMEELGMGALLGVALGSDQPPKLIVLRYHGDPDNPSNNLGLVGKGITFDSGGLSLKPASGMEEMKRDMSGGASVIGSMKALAQLRPRINVSGIIAATENMPGPSAQRPGDIVRTMSGKTIEVLNTDAEGRLVLADALCYARQMGLNRLVDVATLTGAIVIALGNACGGIMGNNQELIEQVIKAGDMSGERFWQLPMYDDYREQIKSNVANVKNIGGRAAGSITAAMILAEFSEDTPWAHLDIAGTAWTNKEKGYMVKGATGVPCRTLVNLALEMGQP